MAVPEAAELPAALSEAMAKLHDGLQAHLRTNALGSLHSPSRLAVGAGGGASSTLAALQLEGAERRYNEMREAYRQVAAERDAIAGELQKVQQQVQAGSAAAAAPTAGLPGAQSGSAPGATSPGPASSQAKRLQHLLQQSIVALHGACRQVEAAACTARPSVTDLRQGVGLVVSELMGLEATVGLLMSEVSKNQTGSTGQALALAEHPSRRASSSPEDDAVSSSGFTFSQQQQQRSRSVPEAGRMGTAAPQPFLLPRSGNALAGLHTPQSAGTADLAGR